MSIRPAAPADHETLKALWMAAFQDSREATDFYFLHRHRDDWMLVEEDQGQLRGMLSMLPIQLVHGGQAQPARYLFAIATHERFRGQGISTRLMLEAERLSQEQGCVATLLVPASAPLFSFYAKRGYQPCFSYRSLQVSARELSATAGQARLYVPRASQMLDLRDQAFGHSRLYARWDEQALAYVRQAAQVYGAALMAFEQGEARGYAYGEWQGPHTLVVKEMALINAQPLEALAWLHRSFQAQHYQLRLPGDSPLGEPVSYGLIKSHEPLSWPGAAPYLALGKD